MERSPTGVVSSDQSSDVRTASDRTAPIQFFHVLNMHNFADQNPKNFGS
jgi:hypothetical protein